MQAPLPRRSAWRLTAMVALAALAAATPRPTLVICAPGYPGNTAEAQPAMDRFATTIAEAASKPPDALVATYHETEEGGLARLKSPDAQIAIVPLPFFLEHRSELRLAPRLQAVTKGGAATEAWTLVAKAGRVNSASDLEGFELVSLAAYAPEFIRGPALGAWGRIPDSTKLTTSGQVLSALRRAVKGENVAVLLDSAQAAALPTLPFAKDLAIVTMSPKLPAALVCTVGGRMPERAARGWIDALVRMHELPDAAPVLDEVRMARFDPVDAAAVDAARRAWDDEAARSR